MRHAPFHTGEPLNYPMAIYYSNDPWVVLNLSLLVVALLVATADAFAGSLKAAPKGRKAPVKKVAKVAKKAPVKRAPVKKAAKKATVRSAPVGGIGVTPPVGLLDPLGFLSRGPAAQRRFEEMEIKHGRIAMAATLGVITTEAGIRLPGYISYSQDLKFSDVPGTLDGSYFGIPLAGWLQIVALFGALDFAVFRQEPEYAPGDVVQDLPINWVRYDDPEVKTFKLNAERNNGRAAMMGIAGMISHAALGQDALFPIISN
jgi:light-harvesting complex I chlorophyll a/b binding protein 1